MYEQQNRFGVRKLQADQRPAYGRVRPSGDATPPVLEYIRVLIGSPATMPPGFDEAAALVMAPPGTSDEMIRTKFRQTFCIPSAPFLTSVERTQWMQLNPWCPAADVPLVVCLTAPVFASEFDRAAWIAAHPECPTPPAWCPPPPSFATAAARAQWMVDNATCPVPPALDDHVCPIDQPHCHDHVVVVTPPLDGHAPFIAPPAPVVVDSGMNFWKGLALVGLGFGAFKVLTSAGADAALVEQSKGGKPLLGGPRNNPHVSCTRCGGVNDTAKSIFCRSCGAELPRRNPTGVAVPEAALRFIVGNLHVGTSDHNVEENIRKRALKAGVTAAQTDAWVKYALKVHHDNLDLYRGVMSGNLSGRKRSNPKDITYTDGTVVKSPVVQIWDDHSVEKSGFYRAHWCASPTATTGSTVIGYASAGGSHRSVKAAANEVRRLYPGTKVYRNGREV